jgi:uncharacterized SAM-binding protein YcdF (DUF218 family)
MFFILSKILAFIITPILWIVVLLLIAVFSKNQKRKRRTLITAVILLFFFTNSFLFDEAMRRWEIPAVNDSELSSPYDAGIVLGGLLRIDRKLNRLQFEHRNDRLMQAVILYKKGIIRKIFFTSGSGSLEYPEMKEAPLAKRFLLDIGIPETDIIIESESNNTYENAVFSKPLLDSNFTGRKFLLITSASHMRRSLGCFHKAGIEVTAYSTDRMSGPRKFSFDHVFIPNGSTLSAWDSLLHEMIGYLVYKMSGYC